MTFLLAKSNSRLFLIFRPSCNCFLSRIYLRVLLNPSRNTRKRVKNLKRNYSEVSLTEELDIHLYCNLIIIGNFWQTPLRQFRSCRFAKKYGYHSVWLEEMGNSWTSVFPNGWEQQKWNKIKRQTKKGGRRECGKKQSVHERKKSRQPNNTKNKIQ